MDEKHLQQVGSYGITKPMEPTDSSDRDCQTLTERASEVPGVSQSIESVTNAQEKGAEARTPHGEHRICVLLRHYQML